VLALQNNYTNLSSAAGLGLVGLTKYWSTYWVDKNVRVNAISPGGVYTNQPEEFVKKLTKLIPMGHMANVDEYKAAVIFMCSDASSYMTGQNVSIDGGRTFWQKVVSFIINVLDLIK
jgi:NAD(P)-dependent dehydrogenase (short-subunit alcohol dehydrogenase family)